jgi:hypothetical protein
VSSTCHLASLNAINTPAEIKYALTQAGQGAAADAINDQALCFFPDKHAPSVNLANMQRAASYNGDASTCDAVASGEDQRLCCCSTTGCAASA